MRLIVFSVLMYWKLISEGVSVTTGYTSWDLLEYQNRLRGLDKYVSQQSACATMRTQVHFPKPTWKPELPPSLAGLKVLSQKTWWTVDLRLTSAFTYKQIYMYVCVCSCTHIHTP